MRTRDVLERRLLASAEPHQADWFARSVQVAESGTRALLLQIYTDASRQLGATSLAARSAGRADASADHGFDGWTLEDAGRLVLLLARSQATSDADGFAADATACFEEGDSREQRSWLRAVAHLPQPERYLPLVIDACRTNILPLFEAIACDNPYPARFFPERNFNQVVLKSLFNNVALARIQGLDERANSELSRMAGDYAAERRAAGRPVPADIGLAMTAGPAQRT